MNALTNALSNLTTASPPPPTMGSSHSVASHPPHPQTTASSLLERVAPLPTKERDREVVAFARSSPLDVVASVITQLDQGGVYERRLASLMAVSTHNEAWVRKHATDSDPLALRVALRYAFTLAPDVYESVWDDAPAARRSAIMRALVQAPPGAQRTAIADRLFTRASVDWDGVHLLPACSHEVVKQALPNLFHRVVRWQPLARAHPEIALSTLMADLADIPVVQLDALSGWWNTYRTAIRIIAQNYPAGAGAILDAILAVRRPRIDNWWHTWPEQDDVLMACLVRDEPGRVVDLTNHVLHWSPYGHKLSRVRSLSTDKLLTLARAFGEYHGVQRVMAALPPAARLAFYNAARDDPGLKTDSRDSLKGLPFSERTPIVRALLRDAEEEEKHLKELLPPDEARDTFLGRTRASDVHDRTIAWYGLISNAIFWRDSKAMTAVIEAMATRMRHEQEDARRQTLRHLQEWRATALIAVDALPHLATVLQHSLDNNDSESTKAVRSLAIQTLIVHANSPAHGNWAVGIIAKAARPTDGTDGLGHDSDDGKPKAHDPYNLHLSDVPQKWHALLCSTLAPLMDEDAKRDDYTLALDLAKQLGQDANDHAVVADLVLRAMKNGSAETKRKAIKAWLIPRKTRSARVEQVLDLEPSAAGRIKVLTNAIAEARTDLLDRSILAPTPPAGIFFPKGELWTTTLQNQLATRRWTPAQTDAYISQLRGIASDDHLPMPTRVKAIRVAESVPGGLAFMREWTRQSDSGPIGAEGFRGLGASPDDLELLLAHANDDSARYAVYAAARAANLVPPSVLEPLLGGILHADVFNAKVTSRKVAVRLIGMYLPAAKAIDHFERLMANPAAHKHVRAAVIAATAQYLVTAASPAATSVGGTTTRALDLLAAAPDTCDDDEVSTNKTVYVKPWQLARPLRERYAGLILAHANSDHTELSLVAMGYLDDWARLIPGTVADSLGHIIADMDARERRAEAAARNLVRIAFMPEAVTALCTALTALFAHSNDATGPPGGHKQRASYRRALMVGKELVEAQHFDNLCRTAAATSAVFQANDAIPLAVKLRLGSIDFSEESPLPSADEVVDAPLARMVAERPLLAQLLCKGLHRQWDYAIRWDSSDRLFPLANELARRAAQPDVDGGGFLRALIAQHLIPNDTGRAGSFDKTGWEETLLLLRESQYADVRDKAWTQMTVSEGKAYWEARKTKY